LAGIVLPYFIVLGILIKKYLKPKHSVLVIFSLALAVWTLAATYIYKLNPTYPVSNLQLLTIIVGGSFAIIALVFVFHYFKKDLSIYLWTSFSIITLAYLLPWLRNPGFAHATTGRYLIISGAGLSFFVGLIFAQLPKIKTFIVIPFAIFFLLHMNASGNYLQNLEKVRNAKVTEPIRNVLVLDNISDTENISSIYYFESDNPELLYHSVMFGFPMFMKFYHGAKNPWNIAYTESWNELVVAYLDGSSLKRFGIKSDKPVALEYVHSYSLIGNELKDTTEETRKKLVSLKKTN